MGITVDRQGKLNISLGVLFSILAGIPTAYFSTQAVLSQEIKKQIREETRPLVNAFEITLQQNVNTLRKAIVALEFKRDMCGGVEDQGCWTVRDAQDLSFARDELRAAEEALSSIRESKR